MLNSIQSKLIIPVALFAMVSTSIGYIYFFNIKESSTELVGINTANAIAIQVKNLRLFYSQSIFNIIQSSVLKTSPESQDNKRILSPDYLVNTIGKLFAKEYPGASIKLYNRSPLKNETNTETYDTFVLEAISIFEKYPSQSFYRLEYINGHLSLRYAVPDIMKDSCIGCYNIESQSMIQDWKDGDVRGIFEVIIPVSDAETFFSIISFKILAFIGVSLLGMALIMIMVYRKTVVQPIKSIEETNKRIRSGDLKSRVIVYSHDELGIMTSGFNLLLDRLLNLIESKETEREQIQDSIMKLLEEVSDVATGDLTIEANVTEDITGAIADSFNHMIHQLRQIVLNVHKATMLVSSAANQIQQNSEALAEGSATQVEQILDSAASLDEMAVSIQQVSENASLSAIVAEQALNSSKKGSMAVQNTIQAMNCMSHQVQEIAKRIKSLDERSHEIGEIVNLIAEISDRTSVLALNASIEASLAGDAGQGFAIVAHEVERLAVRASDATKQINDLVYAIQGETSEAMIAMEENTSEVGRGSNVADQAGQALREIESVSSRLADLIQSISLAATQQARGSENLSQAMNEISNITQQATSGTKRTVLSINELVSFTDELRESVSIFKIPV